MTKKEKKKEPFCDKENMFQKNAQKKAMRVIDSLCAVMS